VLLGLEPEVLAHLRSLGPGQVARLLPVFPSDTLTDGERPITIQGMSGRYEVSEAQVCFTPRHPFLAGTSYTMFVRDNETLAIERPAVGGEPSTVVVGVHPTAPVLPRNALRFYIHFSAPMTYGLAARHVHLERADNAEPILGAFSPMDPELWDLERRRLTVLLDPARIKRGLAPHREAGYPLEEGTFVTLVVSRGFLDAAGRPLVADHRQTYGVGPDFRSRVNPDDWSLSLPGSGGMLPLVARFDRPLDRALLGRCLTVTGPDQRPLTGTASVSGGDESWSFKPDSPWQRGQHRLWIDPVLEDVAGNSLIRVFDRDLDEPEQDPREANTQSLPFVIGDGDGS
jgi:hypothetical protein